MSDDFQNLWQSQPPESFQVALKDVRERAVKFQRRVRLRNLREYLAAVLVLIIFTWMAFTAPDPMRRAGSILIVAGALYIVWHLYRWGASRAVTGDCLQFHRRELERQRDLLQNIWRWYLGPMIPGLLVIILAGLRDKGAKAHPTFVIVYMIVCSLFFYGVGRLNQRAARRLQRQIEQLDKLREP
jgi:hypothetical protein